jgi:hypothetical protein
MEIPASHTSTCLPLSWRLRRALLVALILGLWAPIKIVWEQEIGREQDVLRYNGAPMTRQLRDELTQGLTIGVLAGMRNIVADFVWLQVTVEWMNSQWFRMSAYINLCTSLQPRAVVFWEMGGWHLAWNASVYARHDPAQPNELRRMKASRFWIDRGLDIFKRGIENNPTSWKLWLETASLYDQRLKDYRTAAYYYQKASEQPGALAYVERAPAEMYDQYHLNDPQTEYAEWVKLWQRLTPEQKAEKQHTADRLEREIRTLEQKLSIPKEKRIFPN